MAELSDTRVLIERVQQGDEAAQNDLLRRYQARVLRAVRIRLGTQLRQKLESMDVLQEVMIDALKNIESFEFRTEGAFMKFLNQVVENRIRDLADHWDAQKRRPDREVPLEIGRSSGAESPLMSPEDRAADTPSKIVSLAEDLALVERAMDLLGERSPEYRDLLVAIEIEGQAYKEIAEATGASPDAVRMKVGRARLALAKIVNRLQKDG